MTDRSSKGLGYQGPGDGQEHHDHDKDREGPKNTVLTVNFSDMARLLTDDASR